MIGTLLFTFDCKEMVIFDFNQKSIEEAKAGKTETLRLDDIECRFHYAK